MSGNGKRPRQVVGDMLVWASLVLFPAACVMAVWSEWQEGRAAVEVRLRLEDMRAMERAQ